MGWIPKQTWELIAFIQGEISSDLFSFDSQNSENDSDVSDYSNQSGRCGVVVRIEACGALGRGSIAKQQISACSESPRSGPFFQEDNAQDSADCLHHSNAHQ